MVDHQRPEEWARRGHRRPPDAGDEPDEERLLRDLQERAGNRAVTGALESMRDPAGAASPAAAVDSPGLRLINALRSTPANVQRQAAGGLLRRGMRGPEVESLQADLAGLGYALAVDGIFGPVSQAAVVTFQQRAGLAADGIVGPATRAALASGGKSAGKGSVGKEAWAPTEEEVAAKGVAAKESAAKDASSIEQEAWAPTEEDVAAKGAVKEATAKEALAKDAAAKDAAAIEQEGWAPTEEEAPAKTDASEKAGSKITGSTEKDDSWLA